MGKLIPDYFLSPSHQENPIFTDFKVHQTISCGSDHRLLTASLTNSSHNLSSIWGTPPSNHIEWSNEKINIYKHESHKSLTEILLTTPKTKQDITRLGRNITEALTEALSSISTPKMGTHSPSKQKKPIYESDKTYIRASKEQASLLQITLPKLNTKHDRHKRLMTWSRIHTLHIQMTPILNAYLR
jgi:hypothetical protein